MNKIIDICTFYPKSKIKAGEGMTHGRFPFYTSSNTLNKYLNSYQIEEDGIILGTGGNASIHYCSGRFSASTDCLVICSKNPDIYNEYLYYYLLNSIHILENGFRGAGLKHISKKYIEDIEINYIPDVNIQKKIINIINKSKILINKRKEQIEALDELVKSKFIEMFSEVNEYVSVSEYIESLTAGKSLAGESECKNKVLNTGSISYDYFDMNQVKNLPNDYIPKEEHLVNVGDVLISRMNTSELVGATAYVWNVNPNTYIPDRLWKANFKPNCNPIFVWQLLIQSSTKEKIRRIASGTSGSMKNISKPGLLGIEVIKVDIEKQNEFANFVKQVDKLKFEMEKSLKELEDNFNSLMQKAFKGELFN